MGARLREIRLRCGGEGQVEFAQKLGFSKSAYARFESGEQRPSAQLLRRLTAEHKVAPEEIVLSEAERMGVKVLSSLEDEDRERFARLAMALLEPRLDGGWVKRHLPTFLEGAGRAWITTAIDRAAESDSALGAAAKAAREALAAPVVELSSLQVPLYRIAAGQTIDTEDIGDTKEVPAFLAEEKIDYAMRVVGDSMIDAGIRSGDIVYIRKAASTVRSDSVVVRKRGTSEVTLKQVYHRGEDVELRPANETMKPIIWKAKDVIIEGVVVALDRPSWRSA